MVYSSSTPRVAAALVAITVLAYLPTFHAGFIWDDDSYVEHNPTLRTLAGLWRIWTDPAATPQYYPLVHTTFWVEAHVWGVTSAVPFHAVNVLLQATAAVLLWRLLARLAVPGAWLAAALFAVHPVQVESVAWVTERKNVLSGVLYLLAFGAYLNAYDDPKKPRMYIRGSVAVDPRWYAAAFCLFLLALLAKTVTATLPAAVLLVLWWKRGRLAWRDVWPLVPFLVAGALLGFNTGHLERAQVGAAGREFAFSPADRVLIAGRAVWFYAAKLAVPWPLSFIYPRWAIDPRQPWQWAFPVAAVAAVAALWLLRRRVGRGPLAAVLFFGGTLVPALGLANVYPMRYSFVADHFQYLACIGPLTLLAAGLSRLPLAGSRTHGVDSRSRKRQTWTAAALVASCVGLSFARSTAYVDRLTLWTDTVAKNPTSWMAHTNLAHALVAAGRPDAAWGEYQAAARFGPGVPETHWNLAVGDARRGDYAAAEAECRAAVDRDPGFAPAYATLSKVLARRGRLPEAVTVGRRATAVGPGFAGGHTALAAALDASGHPDEAATEYVAAAAAAPGDASVQLDAADYLARRGRFAEAAGPYESAVSLEPGNGPAWTRFGFVLLNLGRRAEAADALRHAVSIDPSSVQAARGLRLAGGSP